MEYWHEAPIYGLGPGPAPRRETRRLDSIKRPFAGGIDVMKNETPEALVGLPERETRMASTADLFVQCCVFGEAIYG